MSVCCREPKKRVLEFQSTQVVLRLLALDSGNQLQILEIGCTEIGCKMGLLILAR